MHSRQEWTTYRPDFSPARKGVPDIFIHHEGGGQRGNPTNKPAVLREIESYVRQKGYEAIDYNVMVFQDGSIWAGRGVQNEDAATWHNNATSQSICAVGNFELERAPDALIHGIQLAILEIVQSGYTISNPHIRAHKEVYGTVCPGKNIIGRFDEIKNWRNRPPTPTPPKHGGKPVHFIQWNNAIAISDGLTKNIYGTPKQFQYGQWCAAVGGCPNITPQIVDKDYWDSLPTVTG